MVPEILLEKWLLYGLAAYKAQPLLTEHIFHDDSHEGTAAEIAAGIVTLEDGLLIDPTKSWLPDFFAPLTQNSAGGISETFGYMRYAGEAFPILGNTPTQLTLTGDPSLLEDAQNLGYSIVTPSAAKLIEYFATHDIPVVHTVYTQVPTEMPAFTISLHQDTQGEAYWDEARTSYVTSDGQEHHLNTTQIDSQYIIGVWTINPLETFYLYSWLLNRYVGDIRALSTLGFANGSMRGTDIHPVLPFVPERGYVRYFTLAATRPERALTLIQLEAITDFTVKVYPEYARIEIEGKAP